MISCLCFSKDRPMQLEAYIRTLKRFSSSPVKLSILYKAVDEAFREAYAKLEQRFPDVEFIVETDFKAQVKKWLRDCGTPLMMFGCDDVLFKEDFDMAPVAEAFRNPDLFGFSLRLGLNVTYGAMHRIPEARPDFIARTPFLLWNWRQAEHDWGFPFELDCTVYRKVFVEKIIEFLDAGSVTFPNWPDENSSAWGHPNRLECFCSVLVKKIDAFPLMASFSSSKAIVVTVNRVQDECDNLFYDDAGGALSGKGLLEMWNGGVVMDEEAYGRKTYRSIHIGEIFLCKRDNASEKIEGLPEYDVHKTMITDFARMSVKVNAHYAQHPEFPEFIRNFDNYFHAPGAEKDIPVSIMPCLNDKTTETKVNLEYFYQDTWCFSRILAASPSKIVDLGSTVLLVGVMSKIAPVERIDIRPLTVSLPNLSCRRGSITDLPFPDGTVECLSSICVIEHIGLGRYGDPIDPEGSVKALREISRVIAPGGHFIGSVPIAREAFVCFNANRVFRREYILSFFPGFELLDEQYLFPEPGPPEKLESLRDFSWCTWCFDLKKN